MSYFNPNPIVVNEPEKQKQDKSKSKPKEKSQPIDLSKIPDPPSDAPSTIFDYGKIELSKNSEILTKKLKLLISKIEKYDDGLQALKQERRKTEESLKIVQKLLNQL